MSAFTTRSAKKRRSCLSVMTALCPSTICPQRSGFTTRTCRMKCAICGQLVTMRIMAAKESRASFSISGASWAQARFGGLGSFCQRTPKTRLQAPSLRSRSPTPSWIPSVKLRRRRSPRLLRIRSSTRRCSLMPNLPRDWYLRCSKKQTSGLQAQVQIAKTTEEERVNSQEPLYRLFRSIKWRETKLSHILMLKWEVVNQQRNSRGLTLFRLKMHSLRASARATSALCTPSE